MPPEFDEAPAEQDQPVTPEAPETDQPTEGEESFTDSYNPSELPEDVRPHVEAAYKQLQSDYTTKTQSLAEERREAEQAQAIIEGLQNPELAPLYLKQLGYDPNDPQFLGMLGYELADDEMDEDEYVDPEDRINRLESFLAEQENQRFQEQQMAQVEDLIAEGIEKMEGDEPFDEDEIAIIRNYAETHPDPRGMPNVKGGVDLLRGIVSKKQQAWIDSKKSPRAPGSGSNAKRQVDLSTIKDPAERKRAHHELVVQAAEEAQASGE